MPRKTRGESFVTSLGIVGRGEAAASELGAAAHACTPRKTRGESCVTSFGDSKSGVLTDSAARGGVRGDGLPTQLIALRASVARPDDDKSRTFHRRQTKDEKLFGACAQPAPLAERGRPTVVHGPRKVPLLSLGWSAESSSYTCDRVFTCLLPRTFPDCDTVTD